jgi:hypothetical protein
MNLNETVFSMPVAENKDNDEITEITKGKPLVRPVRPEQL